MTIGERIKLLRCENNLTQTELAEKIKTTKQNIYKYEMSIITNIPIDKIEKLSRVFNCSPAYLMGWEEKTSDRPAPLQLTKKENKLISDFRSLSEQGQDYVIQTMDMVKDKYKIDSENMRLVADGSNSVSPLSDDDDAILSEPRNITTDILSELKDITAHQRTPTSTK